MRIASYNCRSLNTHINEILQIFVTLKLDVLCLQETLDPNTSTLTLLEKSGLFFHIQFAEDLQGRGVGILSRQDLSPQVMPTPPTYTNRILRVGITDPATKEIFEILNIYAPVQGNGEDRTPFFKDLGGLLNPIQNGSTMVIAGDFNMVETPKLDFSGEVNTRHSENAKVMDIFSKQMMIHDLVDTYRVLHKDKREYSFVQPNSGSGSRIDRIYLPTKKSSNIREAVIYPKFLTNSIDHKLIFITYNSKTSRKKETYTKLNPIYLEDENFNLILENTILDQKLLRANYRNSLDWWEDLKKRVIERYKKYGKDDHFSDEIRLRRLYHDLARPETPKDDKSLIWEEIEIINNKKVKRRFGATRDSFFKLSNFEKAFVTTYTLDKIKDRDESLIDELETENSQTCDLDEIENQIRDFYSKLYSSDNPEETDIDNFLDMPLPKIPDNERGPLEGLVEVDEVKKAMIESNKGKTPGPDGIPLEFYQKFWPILGQEMTEVFNNIFLSNTAPGEFNHSVIKLIYKGKGPRKLLKNWRPISLLNSDYKILTKVLANRTASFLPDLINQAQSCAIKGRNMTDNLYNIHAIMESCKEKNEKALIVTLDQEKAFDRIEHKYLFKVLEKFNFPDDYIRWVRILYTGAKAKVNANGSLTGSFEILRSVRQGCPLSMILYIICIEPLARKIIADFRIRGVYVVNIRLQVKISQYADDTCLILLDILSLRYVYLHYEAFSKASGSKVNADKTKILPIGNWTENELTPIQDHVVLTIEVLGIKYGGDIQRNNWVAHIGQCRSTIKKWTNLELSFKSKAYVINTFIISKFLYTMTAIGIDEEYAKILQRLIMQFIWNGLEMVSRQLCYLPIMEGGLGVPNIIKRAEAILVHRINKIKVNMITTVPWAGYLIYSMAFSIRQIRPDLFSNLYRKRTNANTFGLKLILGIERIKSSPIFKDTIWQEKKSRPLYEALLDRTNSMVVRRYPQINWREFWTQLWKDKNRKEREKEFLFRQIHGKLPTFEYGDIPSVRTLKRTRSVCRLCDCFTETNEHLFGGFCPLLKAFREHVYRYILHEMPNATSGISEDNIFRFGLGLPGTPPAVKQRLFRTVSAFKQAIWRSRTQIVIGNVEQITQVILVGIFQRILNGNGTQN